VGLWGAGSGDGEGDGEGDGDGQGRGKQGYWGPCRCNVERYGAGSGAGCMLFDVERATVCDAEMK
jgi:hypothetical protein